MLERKAELRQQLAYIERELKRGEHDYDGRESMLKDQRRRVREQLDSK